jgi:hypothetical protein
MIRFEFIEKLKKYSFKKQFFILFFIATIDVWIMPILSILIYATGLDSLDFFQYEYREFLWNNNAYDWFKPDIITHMLHYWIYIYFCVGELDFLRINGLGKPVAFLNIFHIISFALFIMILKSKEQISKNKKRLILFLGVVIYYFLGYFTFFLGFLETFIRW